MEILPSDINLTAELGYLLYADGYSAKIAGVKPAIDQTGKDAWEFTLDPTEQLIKRYNLKPNTNPDLGMLYKVQLPYEFVIQLNPDPAWNRWLYLRNYDGSENPELEKIDEKNLLKEIQKLKNSNIMLQNQLEVANEELYLVQSDIPKYMKKNLGPLMEQIIPLAEKMAGKTQNG